MVSTYSGAVVRTTHLSGMFTDLGIFLGHFLRGLPVDMRRLRLCFLDYLRLSLRRHRGRGGFPPSELFGAFYSRRTHRCDVFDLWAVPNSQSPQRLTKGRDRKGRRGTRFERGVVMLQGSEVGIPGSKTRRR